MRGRVRDLDQGIRPAQVDNRPSELSSTGVERFNRRHILIAVFGAAGLALVVDKFVLSDGLTSPAGASAGQAPQGPIAAAGEGSAKQAAATTLRSPASKLVVYHKSSADALAASASPAPDDAMSYPAWAASGTDRAVASPTADAKYKDVFILSGVARSSVRLRREGDSKGMERGRVLRVGDQVAWSPESGVSVRLVSISPDKGSAIIEVDGERRELTRVGSDITDASGKGQLSPLSTIRVEKAQETPGGRP